MPVTVRATDILFNNGTTQNSAGVTSAVTSAVAGNGIGVSGATGAVTFSVAAPGFNTVGSYASVSAQVSYNPRINIVSGSNYSAGNGAGQIQTGAIADQNGVPDVRLQNNLSGTWKWMGPFLDGEIGFRNMIGSAVRVS